MINDTIRKILLLEPLIVDGLIAELHGMSECIPDCPICEKERDKADSLEERCVRWIKSE